MYILINNIIYLTNPMYILIKIFIQLNLINSKNNITQN